MCIRDKRGGVVDPHARFLESGENDSGEFLILFGVFNAKLPIAMIAALGVVGAAVYALRLYIRAMHNRVGPKVTSFEITPREAVPVAGMVIVILVLAFYPQFGLRRSAPSVRGSLAAAQLQGADSHQVAQAP